MRKRSFPIARVLLLTLAGAAATTSALAQTAAINDSDSGWRAMSACAEQPTEGARHACMDDVLRRAGLLTPERETRQQLDRFGLKGDPRSPATPRAPTSASPATPRAPTSEAPAVTGGTLAPSASSASSAASTATASSTPAPSEVASGVAPPPAPSTVEVELARVSTTHDEKLILTTTDGAVWRQIEGVAVRPVPAAGDRITIRRASLGSYLCEVRKNVGFRCSRTK